MGIILVHFGLNFLRAHHEDTADDFAVNIAAARDLIDASSNGAFGDGEGSGRSHGHDNGEDQDGSGGDGELHGWRIVVFWG